MTAMEFLLKGIRQRSYSICFPQLLRQQYTTTLCAILLLIPSNYQQNLALSFAPKNRIIGHHQTNSLQQYHSGCRSYCFGRPQQQRSSFESSLSTIFDNRSGRHRMLSSPSPLSSTKDESNNTKDRLHSEEQQQEEPSLTNQQCYDNIDLDTIDDFKNNPPLESLCLATLQACQAMTPMIEAMYDSINQSNEDNDNNNSTTASTNNITKTKADDSIFTIADGLVQHLLTEQFLMEKAETPNAAPKPTPYQRPQQPATTKQKHTDSTLVGQIVGEEDCEVQLTEKPYKVDKLEIPSEFEDLIDQAKQGVRAARDRLLTSKSRDYIQKHYLSTKLTAFIDPIDGTKEFSTQKGDQCTICVGFASAAGFPVAGVVYRPLSKSTKSKSSPTWAVGAKSEGFAASSLNKMTDSSENKDKCRLLTTNGSISRFLETVMSELDYERYPSGGAGNKMLLLLEGLGSAYIQDRGVSRWDTCAAQAVLEAHGGILCKLDRFLEIGDIVEQEDEPEDDEIATKTAIDTDDNNNKDTKNDTDENEDNDNYDEINATADGKKDTKNGDDNDDDDDDDVYLEINKALDEIKPKENDEADYDYLTTSYKYFKTDKNLDFVPGRARLTKYNASKKLLVNDATHYSASKGIFLDEFKYHQIAMAQDEVKPYANLCGLVALPANENNPARRKEIINGLREAAQVHLPAFD